MFTEPHSLGGFREESVSLPFSISKVCLYSLALDSTSIFNASCVASSSFLLLWTACLCHYWEPLWLILSPPRKCRVISWCRTFYLIMYAKSLLPHKVTFLLVPEIRAWTPLVGVRRILFCLPLIISLMNACSEISVCKVFFQRGKPMIDFISIWTTLSGKPSFY